MRKIFFKFLKISILWPFTFYSDPALANCAGDKALFFLQIQADLISEARKIKRVQNNFSHKICSEVFSIREK
jgi:hypothetical protein